MFMKILGVVLVTSSLVSEGHCCNSKLLNFEAERCFDKISSSMSV